MRLKLRLRGDDSPFSIRRRTKTNPSVYDSHSFLFLYVLFFTRLPSIFPFSYLRTFQTQGKTIFDTPIHSCPDACSVLCLPLDRWFFVFHRFSSLLRFTAASSFFIPRPTVKTTLFSCQELLRSVVRVRSLITISHLVASSKRCRIIALDVVVRFRSRAYGTRDATLRFGPTLALSQGCHVILASVRLELWNF